MNYELQIISYLCTEFIEDMRLRHSLLSILGLLLPLMASAQKVTPSATYIDDDNNTVDTTEDFTAQAPLDVTFRANPEDIGDHTVDFEWHIRKNDTAKDLVVRYEEDTQYRFVESGTFSVILKARYTDTDVELDSAVIKVTISESRLEMPNAFSPNGDNINDIYGAKGVNDPLEEHRRVSRLYFQPVGTEALRVDGCFKGLGRHLQWLTCQARRVLCISKGQRCRRT